MRGEVVPALVAAGGGAALLGAMTAYEYRQERQMRRSRPRYAMRFPARAKLADAIAALEAMSGLGPGIELVAEAAATEEGIAHHLFVPRPAARAVIDQFETVVPGAQLTATDEMTVEDVTASLRVAVPVGALLRTDASEAATRALLSALRTLRRGERVQVRWALRPAGRATSVPAQVDGGSLRAAAQRAAWRAREGRPLYKVAGLALASAAERERARQLLEPVASVVRSRRGVGRGLMVRSGRTRRSDAMPSTLRMRGSLSAPELLPLLGWPFGPEIEGVNRGTGPRLPARRGLARTGRRLLVGHDAHGERPVALTAEAASHHVAVVGPSGSGKSALLGRGILDDLGHRFGGVVLDPKGDLVADVLDRVPPEHVDRVVVLDPAADAAVPGLDLLRVGDPDLRADVVLGVLGTVFRDSWGVRTDTYLRLGLRTLSELPDPVLTDWIRLFTDPSFRQHAVSRLRDPLLVAAWQSYEALSPAERNQHVAAPMAKVVSLLSRPAVRAVLAQPEPKLDVGALLAQRRWLLVALPPGRLGEPAARLLGAILTYVIWTAIEARSALPVPERHPVFLYFDELQTISTLPFGLEYLFERARGLGCGVTVATQALGRLPESVRQALLGNVGTLITFRLGYEEAVRVARELPGLSPDDLQALGRFQVAARIGTGAGSSVARLTGRTESLPPKTDSAGLIRQRSAERYGAAIGAIDERLQRRADASLDEAPVGRTRRRL